MTTEDELPSHRSGGLSGGDPSSETGPIRGADLARAALETARARNAARRATQGSRRRMGSRPSPGEPTADVAGGPGEPGGPGAVEASPGSDPAGGSSAGGPLSGGRSSGARSSRSSGTGSAGTRSQSAGGRLQRRGTLGLRRTRWSGSGPDRARDPQSFDTALNTWVSVHGSPTDLAVATVFGRWAEIVGADIASHAVPVALVDGDLLLQAESTAWATQLRLLAPTISQRINGRVGRGTVTRDPGTGADGTELAVRQPDRSGSRPTRHLRLVDSGPVRVDPVWAVR